MSPRALIVEDEQAVGLILSEILRQRGFEPVVFDHGQGVVEWVRRHKPDLVLLDLMLPDRDGFEICQELKLERDTNLIPLIMVTALGRHEDVARGLRVGANYYLTKPFNVEQLLEAIDHVLAWRQELGRRGASGEIHFQFHSDLRYLEELNGLLASLLLYTGMCEEDAHRLTTAVREMGVNAIEWGHRKRVDQLVTVTYRIDAEKVEIVVTDQGEGFNRGNLPHAARDEDPVGHMAVREERGLRAGGYGILLSKGLVDELAYNERGNEVRLIKRLAAAQRPPP
jgi:two-component system, OmpR family, response regulator